jgi:hypothetical protein
LFSLSNKENVMNTARRMLTWLLAISLSYAGMLQGAQATMIGADQVAAAGELATPSGGHARLNELLQRDDVVAALRARGVEPEQARERVAALTDSEAAQLAQTIDSSPAAGTDLLGVAVFIFVLLLITDILGFTKIFPFTRSIR